MRVVSSRSFQSAPLFPVGPGARSTRRSLASAEDPGLGRPVRLAPSATRDLHSCSRVYARWCRSRDRVCPIAVAVASHDRAEIVASLSTRGVTRPAPMPWLHSARTRHLAAERHVASTAALRPSHPRIAHGWFCPEGAVSRPTRWWLLWWPSGTAPTITASFCDSSPSSSDSGGGAGGCSAT
jgi:hypothetical protein